MLTLNNISCVHPNRDLLFDNLTLTINKQDKIALIGNNGVGKSTLLQILSGDLQPTSGKIHAESKPYYVPQHFGQFNDLTIAQALGVDKKLAALSQIIQGNVTESNLAIVSDDWLIEERCREALSKWSMDGFDLFRKINTLSGGQKTKVFLAGIFIHSPDFVLLDEPSNHLDVSTRKLLYDYVTNTSNTLVVVSHDKSLLNLLNSIYELSKHGVTVYGGNYDFYKEQKATEAEALQNDLKLKEKELHKAKEIERQTLERKQKLDARGKKKQEKAGMPTIMMNTLRNNAQKSTSRIRDVHDEKIQAISQELFKLKQEVPDTDKMKIDLNSSKLHDGKRIVEANKINIKLGEHWLWSSSLSFQITSGERIALKGINGSGKTTLIKIIKGEIMPQMGIINRSEVDSIYIDQDYSLINNTLTVFEQAQAFNTGSLPEHEVKIRLNRFLFTKESWDKRCGILSGGEKMRLILCCLMISNQTPDILFLDEPTNNLDIQNTDILIQAIKNYKGTVIAVCHDEVFLKEINIQKEMLLN